MLNMLLVLKESLASVQGVIEGHRADIFSEGEHLYQKITKNHYDVILLEDGVKLLPSIRGTDPRAEVILVGGPSGTDAVEVIKQGATAYFPYPVDLEGLKKSIDNIRELVEIRRETAELEKQLYDKYTFAGVVGKNPQMLEIFSFIRRIALYYRTVTIFGETGTGKEEIAKALHSVSNVSDKPFIACNCGSLVEGLIESELFGHTKGAFTGAVSDKMGIFEAAGDGAVFLDEIGELPLSFQPHLLRVLQNGEFKRLGSTQTLKARCRVIAATNRDLASDVLAGRFREDLFFRITPLTINVPPLRERKDDLPFLYRFLIERVCKRTGKKILGISRPAQTALMPYDWPGNVRELENVIEQVCILSTEAFIRVEDIPSYILDKTLGRHKNGPAEPKTLDELIKKHIEAILKQCDGNRTNAAKVLGISRRALLRRIEKYPVK